MNISKTLFKLLTKCNNAPALYNMYINHGLHDVKEINGLDLDKIKQSLSEIKDSDFDEELLEIESTIFNSMYDENSGEDLTIVTSAQLEAFKDIFSDVEYLASKHVEKVFGEKVISSKNTYDQKKFEYNHKGNKYYCYLDIYIEKKGKIKVFEVKSTTSSKIDELHLIFKKGCTSYPVYKMNKDTQIMEYVPNNYIGNILDGKFVDEQLILNKLKTSLNKYSDVGKYLYDISIQRHIIEESYKSINENVPEIDYYLVVLNHKYKYNGKKIDGQCVYETSDEGEELFKIYDVNYLTSIYQELIKLERAEFELISKRLTIENNCLGQYCGYKKNNQCKFFNICHEPILKEGSLLEFTDRHFCFKHLTELNSKKERKTIDMYDLINMGIYTMKDALIYTPHIDQQIQYDCYVNNKQFIFKENLEFLISKITYPLYHLDFESYNCPLPRFKGEYPYTQSLFQYSLHVEKSPGDCEIDNTNGKYHYEYLAPDHNDHRRELAEQMIKDIDLSKGGTVLAYHATFEKTRIKELIELFDDLTEPLELIHDSIFDLEDIIHAGESVYLKYLPTYSKDGKPRFNFYDKNLHASFSIKKLLPIFTDLTYSDLEVQNGTEAILVYGMLPYLTEEEYKNKYLALKKYCRQDTWSMVKILQGLKELIK